jgi:Protein of unknown function (DUF1214)
MTDWESRLEEASTAWSAWCRAVESAGLDALSKTITHDEIDLAEGVRHLARMVRLTLFSATENRNTANPYFWPALDPHLKMGGDNPQGLYLSAPVNGTDTFRITGTSGSARWVSCILGRSPAGVQAGLPPFGNAIFRPDIVAGPDGTFEIFVAPQRPQGAVNWIESDEWTVSVLLRQFFGTLDDVQPMEQLEIENVSAGRQATAALRVQEVVDQLDRSAATFSILVPLMQSEMVGKGSAKNQFVTDIGDPTSISGGVPGGNAVTARWALEPDEALVVEVTPPAPCGYWDVQVGNGWYESFDYRNVFSGFTCENAFLNEDGSVAIVVAGQDPGTANWLETAQHREGHIAIRWQLSEGDLPIPRCTVVKVTDVAERWGLPFVSAEQRADERRKLVRSFDIRFGQRRTTDT